METSKNHSVADVKIPPHSNEAEQAVIGGLMLDNDAWDKVAGVLLEDDFYRHEHKLIFHVMEKLARRDQPFDVVTLTEELKSITKLDAAGGEVYLYEIARNTPSVANIGAYTEIVQERATLRRLIRAATEIAEVAFHPDGRDSQGIVDEAETKVFQIGQQRQRGRGPQDIQSVMAEAFDKVDKLYQSGAAITGLPTGFTDLDKITSGLQNADLVILAARPSMGKTVLGVNIAEEAALRGKKPVLLFSMEMPSEAIGLRLMSSLGRIDQHRIRTGQLDNNDWARISTVVTQMAEAPLFIDDTPALSPTEVRARARRLAKEHGQLGLIVIDYLQLMQVPGRSDNRTAEISEISRTLKALAKELNVPVIALSQLNRSLEQRTDKRPIMSDLRESGAIEQDADLILFIYRDEVYNENSPDKGSAEIIIAKHRNGPIGKIRLTFIGQYLRFDNFTPQNIPAGFPTPEMA